MRRRVLAILALLSVALLAGACAAWLLSTRRFAPYAVCTFYDQRNVPFRWVKGMALPSGLVLRLDRARDANGFADSPGRKNTATAPSATPIGLLWKASPGAGRLFEQPAEWAAPQLRRLDQPYRDYVTHRLLIPWWLLALVLGAAPARWTFVHLRRARRADQGRCPECGSGLPLVEGGRCAACGAATGEIAA
jgi:hypothetical protein